MTLPENSLINNRELYHVMGGGLSRPGGKLVE